MTILTNYNTVVDTFEQVHGQKKKTLLDIREEHLILTCAGIVTKWVMLSPNTSHMQATKPNIASLPLKKMVAITIVSIEVKNWHDSVELKFIQKCPSHNSEERVNDSCEYEI